MKTGYNPSFFYIYKKYSGHDDGEKKSGMGEVTMNVTGTIDPGHKFLLTFSDLVDIQDYPDGVEVSPNESVDLVFPRVG